MNWLEAVIQGFGAAFAAFAVAVTVILAIAAVARSFRKASRVIAETQAEFGAQAPAPGHPRPPHQRDAAESPRRQHAPAPGHPYGPLEESDAAFLARIERELRQP